jgi:4-hydroxybutyryl-CoA synthetase (ADP-forming)
MTIEKWQEVIRLIREGNIPVYDFAETAARALSAMTEYGKIIQKKEPAYKKYRVVKKKAAEILERQKGKDKFLPQDVVFELLRCYGVPTVPSVKVKKEGQLEKAAEKVGYPLVLKVDSEKIVHKTEVGGVAVDLKDKKELFSSFKKMARKFARHKPGYILQRYMAEGQEVIMGAKANEGLHPTIMFGLGGVFVEVLKDVQFRLAPLSQEDAQEMIQSIKGFPILQGARGEKAVDVDKLVEILIRLSQLASDFPEINEMDLNPVFALEKGNGAVVVDARLRIVR